jgi:hypothetical protein
MVLFTAVSSYRSGKALSAMRTLMRRLHGGPMPSVLIAALVSHDLSSQQLADRPFHPRQRQISLLPSCTPVPDDELETRNAFYIR